jgi:AcrR family transcriptional regulator
MQSRTPASRATGGRPRSAAADAAILAATREALVDLGWSKLTLGDVATRAGVAKTTLYRRWAGKNELVVDAVAELFDELRLPDRGSLAADIEGVVLQFAAILARPEARSGLMAVIAESTRDDALREPPEPDPAAASRTVDLIFDVVAGAVVHRTLISSGSVDEPWVRDFTALLLRGLSGDASDARPGTSAP